MAKSDLTASRVRELFEYDPKTGILTRLPSLVTRWQSRPATRVSDPRGYMKVRVDQRDYFVHRLVWLHVHGEWPKHQIDHINRDPKDNRIENLRDVPVEVNLANRDMPAKKERPARKPKSIGCVYFVSFAKEKPYRAQRTVDGKKTNLGYFKTREEAEAEIAAIGRTEHRVD